MRRHLVISTLSVGVALSVFVGYYVHLKLANVASPPLSVNAKSTNYSPESLHHLLSKPEKQHVLDGQFRVIDSTEQMPPALKQAFAATTGEQQFALANPGQKYQVTDVILEPGLPFRRLVFGGECRTSWFIHYEHGGIGHGYAVVVFQKEAEGRVQFFWGGASSERAKDLDDLRNKVAAGDFRDNLVYYW